MLGQTEKVNDEAANTIIYKTRLYSIFKPLKGNRQIEKRHVTALTSMIMRNNLLEKNPILVNEKYQIIDGQHRLEVAKNNELDIFYVIQAGTDLSDVQMLNATVKRWTTKDYLDSNIALGKSDYIKLAEYAEETGISLSNSMVILGGSGPSLDTTGLRRSFYLGDFRILNPELGELVRDAIDDLRTITEFTEENDVKLIVATTKVLKQIDFQEMMKQFAASGKKIKRSGAVRDYLRQYEDVFNYNKRNQTRFY